MTCPDCNHKENMKDRFKSVLVRKCSTCGRKFRYSVLMNVVIVFALIGSINLVPTIAEWNILFRMLYFLSIYYILIFVFDWSGVYRRKYD